MAFWLFIVIFLYYMYNYFTIFLFVSYWFPAIKEAEEPVEPRGPWFPFTSPPKKLHMNLLKVHSLSIAGINLDCILLINN